MVNPQDAELICFQYHLQTLPLLSAGQVAAQIDSVAFAGTAWSKTSFAHRKMLMRSLKAWVIRDMDAICRVACRDTGKTSERAVECTSDVR